MRVAVSTRAASVATFWPQGGVGSPQSGAVPSKGISMRRLIPALLVLAACEAVPTAAPRPGPPPERPSEAQADCSGLIYIWATDNGQGLAREAAWLAENRPGYALVSRTAERCGGTPVHRVAYVQDGVAGVVLFDASSYFGRVDGDDLDDLLDG